MEVGGGRAGGRSLGLPAVATQTSLADLFATLPAVPALLLVAVAIVLLLGAGALRRRRDPAVLEAVEALRRSVGDLDQGLRREIAVATQSSLRAAFDQVLDGNNAMHAALATFQAHVSDSLRDSAQSAAHSLTEHSRIQREEQERLRGLITAQLDTMRQAVEERLQQAVQQKVGESFARVTEQLAQLHQDIGQVQSVAAQVGDLKRLFSNVRTRGGWGEAQVEAMLQDALPPGSYARNVRLREGSAEMVEFALRVPVGGPGPASGGRRDEVWLAIDAKFPTEDYDRMLLAAEAGSREDEADARRGLERRIRAEAARIGGKYVLAPRTVEFAVLYLPTDGLFAEVARTPGLIEQVRRDYRVMVMGPSLLPAFLHTIRVGHLTMALEQRAGEIGTLLAAVKTEWERFAGALDKLASRAAGLGKDIDEARTRSRIVGRKLAGVDALAGEHADQLLGTAPAGAAVPD